MSLKQIHSLILWISSRAQKSKGSTKDQFFVGLKKMKSWVFHIINSVRYRQLRLRF